MPSALSAADQPVAGEKRSAPVQAGDVAIDFTLVDQDGRKHTLSAERGKRPVVLIFYRGYWWPYCTRQFAELRSLLKPNEQVALWGISVDTAEQSKEFIEKIADDGRGRIAFPLLSDPQHRVIDAYGLQDPRYLKQKSAGIPYPAAYVIAKTGRIAWSRIDIEYPERPPNAEIRAALDALEWRMQAAIRKMRIEAR